MKLDKHVLGLLSRVPLFEEEVEDEDEAIWRPKKKRKSHNGRVRRYVNSIFQELGPDLTRRAYRMAGGASSFWKLEKILDAELEAYHKPRDVTGRGCVGGVKNGKISNATRLSCAIRYLDPLASVVLQQPLQESVVLAPLALLDYRLFLRPWQPALGPLEGSATRAPSRERNLAAWPPLVA